MRISDEAVDCLKRIDLTQGFTSWHIKWPVGILGPDFEDYISSVTFDTLVGNKPEVKLSWWLRLEDPKETLNGTFAVSLCPSKVCIQTPVIYRFALCYENDDPIFTGSYCNMITSYIDCRFKSSSHNWLDSEQMDGSYLRDDVNLTVHCWIDIPKDAIKLIKFRRKRRLDDDYNDHESETDDGNTSNIQDFLDNSEALYKGAIGEDQRFASLSDVTLQMKKKSRKSDGRFYCQRSILAARSPVFLSMFATTKWKEGEDRIVEIDDIEEEIMKLVLYHIYTGQFLDMEDDADIQDLTYAADKYQLKNLKAWSEAQLITGDDFDDDDRIDHLELADRHQLNQLKAACIAMLSSNVNLLKRQQRQGVPDEIVDELVEAVSKRQLETKEIETANEDK